MYFKQVCEIVMQRKTCTQRVVKDGETALGRDGVIIAVYSENGRTKWMVGREYSVVLKRGMPAALLKKKSLIFPADKAHAEVYKARGYVTVKILLTRIERVNVQAMDERVAVAEGVENVAAYVELWRTINKGRGTRWEDDPQVWRLWFEFVG